MEENTTPVVRNRSPIPGSSSNAGCEGVQKRRKLTKTDMSDRLSDLPDLAVANILSHLPFHEAIQTSVLSKRFHSLWNFVPSLTFSDRDGHPPKNHDQFVHFVTTSLMFHRRSHLEKFHVQFRYFTRYSDDVNNWIKFALLKQVKLLHLDLANNFHSHLLPQCLFSNENLVELVVTGCNFSPKSGVNWTSLRLLCINGVQLKEDLVSKVLLGCPVLETFQLRTWSGDGHLKICSSSLKVLRMFFWDVTLTVLPTNHQFLLNISCPNLVSMHIGGTLYGTAIELGDLGRLECAVMDFDIRDHKGLMKWDHNIAIASGVLKGLRHAKTLTLAEWCIKGLSICEKNFISSPSSERKALTLYLPIAQWDYHGVANLLNSSPYLETLVIKLVHSFNTRGLKRTLPFPSDGTDEYYWKSSRTSCRCPLHHLKTVKIVGLEVARGAMKPLFNFLEFVVKNCRQLEEVVVQTSLYVMQEAFEEALKLLSVPTASPDAVLHFEPPELWVDLSARDLCASSQARISIEMDEESLSLGNGS